MIKQPFLFQSYIPQPFAMTVSQQICCMIWLSKNHTLEQLREKQNLFSKQIISAKGKVVDNLIAMQDNVSAAVAHKSFNDNSWMSFINE